jgi:hypothetical protein
VNELRPGHAYVDRIESLRDLIELYDRAIDQCDNRPGRGGQLREFHSVR